MSNLVAHAERELFRLGNSGLQRIVNKNILALIKVFSKQGHSGFSAQYVLDLFNKLSRFKTLHPITQDPNEWTDVSQYDPQGPKLWQNTRDSSYFSNDGGKTWWNVEDAAKKKVASTTASVTSVDKSFVVQCTLALIEASVKMNALSPQEVQSFSSSFRKTTGHSFTHAFANGRDVFTAKLNASVKKWNLPIRGVTCQVQVNKIHAKNGSQYQVVSCVRQGKQVIHSFTVKTNKPSL